MKGKKDESPAPEPMIKGGKGERRCLLDGGKGSVHTIYDSGWMESQMEASITQYDLDPVEHAMEEKEKILVDAIVRRAPLTLNMILAWFKASWRRQR